MTMTIPRKSGKSQTISEMLAGIRAIDIDDLRRFTDLQRKMMAIAQYSINRWWELYNYRLMLQAQEAERLQRIEMSK